MTVLLPFRKKIGLAFTTRIADTGPSFCLCKLKSIQLPKFAPAGFDLPQLSLLCMPLEFIIGNYSVY